MAKYANYLYEAGYNDLLSTNVAYFKNLAIQEEKFNKSKSYRLLQKDGKNYLRGITSEKYNEYGIDFTFFVSIILLHLKMKEIKGSNYSIIALSLNESKLDMIIKENRKLNVEHFGTIALALKISTNELGTGSLNMTSTIRVEDQNNATNVYLFPKEKNHFKTAYAINHLNTIKTVFNKIKEFQNLFDAADNFAKDIKDLKGIKTPDELRHKILMKIEHPNSIFKNINSLKDIFKAKINNEIDNLSKLLEMCRRVEELEIEYDTKDKLRYIISDIILYGNSHV